MMEQNNIVSLFLKAAASYPDKTAIVHGRQKITFAGLQKKVKQTADAFCKKGIQPGDRVLVFVPMSIELYQNVLALFYIGATAVFLDEWVSRERMKLCLEVAPCKGFIITRKLKLLALTSKTLRKIPVWINPNQSSANENVSLYKAQPYNTALITFTTGSTGIPKAANRTHGFLHAQFRALMDKIQPSSHDIGMPVLPIVLLINLGAGCTSVIATYKSTKPHKLRPGKIINEITRNNVNRIEASPYLLNRLAKHLLENHLSVPTVKKVFTGGAPVFPTEAKIFQNGFKEAKVEIVFGSTEAEPVSTIETSALTTTFNSVINGLCVGKPWQGSQVKIIPIKDEPLNIKTSNELNVMKQPINSIGEIIISGEHVLDSYINNPEALKRNKIMIDGTCWHRTGDSGYLNENGFLFLTGRCSQMIFYHNKWLSPFIYENFLMENRIFGTLIQHENKLLIIAEGNSVKESSLREALEKEKMPFDEIKFLSEIPRDPRHHSKIEYGKLTSLMSYRNV